jgi:hypothetical protein
MDYSTSTLGRRVVEQLRTRVASPVVTIGRDRFSRHDLAFSDCFCYVAAARLSDAIAKLDVKDTRDLFRHVEPEQLALPMLGPFAFAVLGTCFEIRGVGTLDEWVERSRVKGSRVVTFNTIKEHIKQHTTKRVSAEHRRRSTAAIATAAADATR